MLPMRLEESFLQATVFLRNRPQEVKFFGYNCSSGLQHELNDHTTELMHKERASETGTREKHLHESCHLVSCVSLMQFRARTASSGK